MAIGTRRLFSFADVASATGGRVVVDPREPEGICSVVTDSRASVEGSLFVALRGERTDGHEFLEQVARSGAAALLVSAEQAGAGRSLRHCTPVMAWESSPLRIHWWVFRTLPDSTCVGSNR